jgi:hypothetical protein
MDKSIKVGALVKTECKWGTPSRVDTVESITVNSFGTTIYILTNGGFFSAKELSIV